MIRRITVAALQLGALAFSLAAFLFAGEAWRGSSGFVGTTIRELEAFFQDSTSHSTVLVCLVLYFIAFSIFELRSSPGDNRWRVGNPMLWQCAFVTLALLGLTIGNSKPSKATLIVLGTILFGKTLSMGVGWNSSNSEPRRIWPMCSLILLLAGSVFWQQEANKTFHYNGVSRWSGPWGYPNLFGLLMGLSLVLSLGIAIRIWHATPKRFWRITGIFFCLVIAIIVGFGLFKSYSRGAWFSTAIGVIYLTYVRLKKQKGFCLGCSRFWIGRIKTQMVIIVFALTILGFWQFRFVEWQPARRVFSAANVNDFSWRNRVATWNGAIQMISDRPFLGCGWGKAEAAYNEEYSSPRMENGAAVQMNDYFVLGISVGFPALVCFLMYVGLSLRSSLKSINLRSTSASQALRSSSKCFDRMGSPRGRRLQKQFEELEWLLITIRTGAIVLSVGFFFDGGLFKLATGSVFWILLELGRVNAYRQPET